MSFYKNLFNIILNMPREVRVIPLLQELLARKPIQLLADIATQLEQENYPMSDDEGSRNTEPVTPTSETIVVKTRTKREIGNIKLKTSSIWREIEEDNLEALKNLNLFSLRKRSKLVNEMFLASITHASFKCFNYLLENFTYDQLGLNKKNEHGLTPLMWIIEYANKTNIALFGNALVNHKDIDLSIRNNNGEDALYYAKYHQTKSKEICKSIREKTLKRKKFDEENSGWAEREEEKRAKKQVEVLQNKPAIF